MEEANHGDETFHFDAMKGRVKDYINNRIEYFKLAVIEYIAKFMPVVVFVIIMGILLLLTWIFANIAVAVAISRATGSLTEGFLIISGFNLVLAVIFLFAYKKIIVKPVSNFTVKILIKSLEADENK